MSAGLSKSQKAGYVGRFRKSIEVAARHTEGLTVTRERGSNPIVADAAGNTYEFGLRFSNASNGESFGEKYVHVTRSDVVGPAYQSTFTNNQWYGTNNGNRSLWAFWNDLYQDKVIHVQMLLDACALDD